MVSQNAKLAALLYTVESAFDQAQELKLPVIQYLLDMSRLDIQRAADRERAKKLGPAPAQQGSAA